MFPERLRTSDDRRVGVIDYQVWSKLPPYNLIGSGSTTGYKVLGQSKTILDMLSHGYRRRKRVLVQHPVEIRSITGYCSPGSFGTPFSTKFNKELWTGEFATFAALSNMGMSGVDSATVEDEQQNDLSMMKATGNLAVPDWDVGVGLAEAKETAEFLMSPIRGVVKVLRKIDKARLRNVFVVPGNKPALPIPRKPKRAKKAQHKLSTAMSRMSDAWLGYRYGVVPLMCDIEDGREWFNNSLLEPCRDLRTKKGTVNESETNIYTRQIKVGYYTFVFEDTVISGTKTTSGIHYFNEMSMVGNRAVQLGLSPNQLLHTMYEAFPLSFMLDWSVNLGDWLNSKCPIPGINQVGNFVSVKQYSSLTRRTKSIKHYYAGAKAQVFSDSILYIRLEKLKRNINVPPPTTPRLNLASKVLNLQRSMDTLALTWSMRPKIFKR
jgi:hypothetical protein